jgi:hypothetical protein
MPQMFRLRSAMRSARNLAPKAGSTATQPRWSDVIAGRRTMTQRGILAARTSTGCEWFDHSGSLLVSCVSHSTHWSRPSASLDDAPCGGAEKHVFGRRMPRKESTGVGRPNSCRGAVLQSDKHPTRAANFFDFALQFRNRSSIDLGFSYEPYVRS